MIILKTENFDKWLKKLKDQKAKAVIQVNINRLIEDNTGKVRSLGEGVHEKKINYGPGYRLYFINHNQNVLILICGGDKSTQSSDIKQEKILAKEIKIDTKGKI